MGKQITLVETESLYSTYIGIYMTQPRLEMRLSCGAHSVFEIFLLEFIFDSKQPHLYFIVYKIV